jgi:hypothetical protein
MIIKSKFTHEKADLPSGSIHARWVYSRGVYQVYLGKKFLPGVNGDTEEECIRELHSRFNTSRTITFH